jgi:hypothetical protein
MPWSVLSAKVMQATTWFHDGVPNPILPEADVVLHAPIAFHPANGLFDPETEGREPAIRRWLRGREFPATRCFLRVEDRDPIQEESLEAFSLIQAAAGWQGIARPLCQALISRVAFTGVAQEANVARLIDHEAGFARVTRLLATVILLWRFGISRAVDRTCGALMPKRGGWTFRPSRALRTSRQTLQLFGLEATRGLRRPDATPDAARESMGSHAIGSSQSAVLVPLEWDAGARRSA